jgi:hypothetical protein
MAGPGHNGASRDDLLFFRGRMRKDEEDLQAAKKQRKKTRQRAELAGIELEVLDMARQLEDEDSNTTLRRMQTLQRYTEFLGLAIGTQLSFLTGADARQPQEDEYEHAYRDGRDRGLEGLPPDDQAYPPLSPLGIEHMKGWNEGQDENKRRLMEMNGTEPPERKRGRPRKPPAEPESTADAPH